MLKGKFVLISTVLLFLVSSLSSVITSKLENVRFEYEKQAKIRVNLILENQYSFTELYSSVKDLPIEQRRETASSILKRHAYSEQEKLNFFLKNLEDRGLVEEIRCFWILNAISFKITNSAIDSLKTIDGVKYIDYDELKYMLNNVELDFNRQDHFNDDPENREVAYNVIAVNADQVWELGYTGEDVIVAVLDTGVNYNHTDIMNNMWTHPDYPYHGYNFVNNNYNPMDYHGHGTHCAGTVAGDGTSGSQTGMAPDAKIMALQVLDSGGNGQDSTIWEATQFSIDNGARIMSISLGWYIVYNPDRFMMRTVMENALATGIIASVAAGNAGYQQNLHPIPHNVATPADCPPPWIHPDQTLVGGISAVFTNGATDSSNNLASFSSRGPVTWQNVPEFGDYVYNPGMGLIKPDICAPGVQVKSLTSNSNTGYTYMSGTSMAAPGTAGVAALLISKNPAISPEEIAQILEENAVPLYVSKNNNTGSGLVDALASINAVPDMPPENPVNPNPVQNQHYVSPQTPIFWENGGWALYYLVNFGTDNPPTNIVSNHETNSLFYQFTETLEPNTFYYWRIDSVNNYGIAEGDVWSFRTGNRISEDFETGDFSQMNWILGSNGIEGSEWFVESNDHLFGGTYAARSGVAGALESSTLQLTVNIIEEGPISFYKKLDTPPNKFLRFYIDDELVSQWWGESDWILSFFNLEAGERSLRWEFYSHNDDGSGTVWIDEISLPFNYYDCITDIDVFIEDYEIGFAEQITIPVECQIYDDFELYSLETVISIDPDILYFYEFELENSLLTGEDVLYSYEEEEGIFEIYWETESPLSDFEISELFFLRLLGKSDGVSEVKIEKFMLNGLNLFYTYNGTVTVYGTPHLEPPQNVSFSMEPGVVHFSWESPESAIFLPAGFNLYRDNEHIAQISGDSNTYSDATIEELTKYEYFLTALYTEMMLESEPSELIVLKTLSSDNDSLALISSFNRVYPNPFIFRENNRNFQNINLNFSIKKSCIVEFDIFNIKGQRIRTINMGLISSGVHTMKWDGKNQSGNKVPQGIYFIGFSAGDYQKFKKMLILDF